MADSAWLVGGVDAGRKRKREVAAAAAPAAAAPAAPRAPAPPSTPPYPLISAAALQRRRAIYAATFFRACGFRGKRLTSHLRDPRTKRVMGEGGAFFSDTRGRRCMVYSCYHEDDMAAAAVVAGRAMVERYCGPADPDRLVVGDIAIWRPLVGVFRA